MKYFVIFVIISMLVLAVVIQPASYDGFSSRATSFNVPGSVNAALRHMVLGTMFGGAEGTWILFTVGSLLVSALRPIFKLVI